MALIDEIQGLEDVQAEVEPVVTEISEDKEKRKPLKRVLDESEVKKDKYTEYLAKVEEAKTFANQLGVDYLGIVSSSINPKYRAVTRVYTPKEVELTENEQLFEDFKEELDGKMKDVLDWATEALKNLASSIGFTGQIPEPTRTLYLAKSEEFKEFLKK